MEKLQVEIIKMQNEVVERAKHTQGVILSMTIVAFFIGVSLVLVAIAQVVLKGDLILGVFSSAGGVATVLGTLFYDPMQKAQNSVGDLAQVQTAFLSFNCKLSIWLEYVRARVENNDASFQDETIRGITADIQTASTQTLDQIANYCKKDIGQQVSKSSSFASSPNDQGSAGASTIKSDAPKT